MTLSSNNLVATVGFLIMSGLAVFFSFTPKLLGPLNVLGHLATTTATLENDYTERRSSRSSSASSTYEVRYTYTVDGKTYSGDSVTDDAPSPTMPVQYVTDDPSRNGMDLRFHAWFDLGLFIIPAVVFLLCAFFLVMHVKRW